MWINDDERILTMIFTTYYYLFLIVSSIMNGFLLYAIIKHSPRHFEGFKYFLVNSSICNLTQAYVASFLGPRQITSSNMLGLVSMGICNTLNSPSLCLLVYQLGNCACVSSCWSIAASMYFRYRQMASNSMTKSSLVALILLSHLPATLNLISAHATKHDFNIVSERIKKEYPTYNWEYFRTISGFENTSHISFLFNTGVLFITGLSLPVLIFFWRYKINIILNEKKSSFSEKTRKSTRTLMVSLTLQALLPLLCFAPTMTMYATNQITKRSPLVYQYIINAVNCLPSLADAFLSFYFIQPYRKWLMSLFCKIEDKNLQNSIIESTKASLTPSPVVMFKDCSRIAMH